MNYIQHLVTEQDWILRIWSKRYGNGMYAMLACTDGQAYSIPEITTSSDIPALGLDYFLKEEGGWLPITSGDNLTEIIDELNAKISKTYNDIEWQKSVNNAFNTILDVSDNDFGLRIAVDNHEPSLFDPLENKVNI